jgi:hypothetical protein
MWIREARAAPPGMGSGNTQTPYRKSFGYCGNREDLSRGPLTFPEPRAPFPPSNARLNLMEVNGNERS